MCRVVVLYGRWAANLEQILPHERVVALGVLLWQLHVLVHVERHYVLEAQQPFLMELD